jgi:hypothetical protein
MDRRNSSIRWTGILTALALVAIAALGCKSALTSGALLWNGYEVPAVFDGLKDKTVAVVCRMVTMEELSNNGMSRALSEALCERLKANNKKIKVIEPQKVAALLDMQEVDDPIEIGRKLKADKVLVVNIESFRIHEGQTLYRGHSNLSVHVYDVETKEEEWHKQPPQIEYPSYGPTPAQEMSEVEFRNNFIAVVAERIGRYFYPHDRYAQDEDPAR